MIRLTFPFALVAMLLFLGLLFTNVFGLKIGQISIGQAHRTIALRGHLKTMSFSYCRPLWGRSTSVSPNALYPPLKRWIGQGVWSNFTYVHAQTPLLNAWKEPYPYWLEQFHIGAPSWLVLLVIGAFPIWYFAGPYRRYRIRGYRHKRGLCLDCGYNLAGNTSGTCPECGSPINSPPEASSARE